MSASTPTKFTDRKPVGGVVFAAGVIALVGALNLVWGIAALSKGNYFHEGALLFEHLKTWGWVHIIIAALQLFVAWLIFGNKPLGYGLGMFASFCSIMVEFLTVGAYPIWSVMLIVLNFIVFFQLATNLDADL